MWSLTCFTNTSVLRMLRSDFPHDANRQFKNFAVSYVPVPMLEIIGRIVSSLSPSPLGNFCNFAVV